MPANEANPIYPSKRERRDLEALVRQQACAQRVALRARIVLLASEGVGIQPSAVRGWPDAKPDPQFAEKCHDRVHPTRRLYPHRQLQRRHRRGE